MEKFICKECNKVYETLKGLSNHRFQKHKIKPQDTYDEYVLNGIKPICNCGCGIVPKFLTITNGYRDYVRGHSSRVNNNWGHNSDAISKSHETQKKMYESGELTIWNKGLTIEDPRVKDNIDKAMSNPNRGKNISKKLSGVGKSEKHKENLSKASKLRWSNPNEREIQSHKRMLWMLENEYTVKSKIEDIINVILLSFGLKENIDYERQSYVRDIKSYYDFKIFKNNVFIEIDGDFWHCNPKTKHNQPIYKSQFKNLEKDKIKNKWCSDNNHNLIRFWEYDINNHIEVVINELKGVL
jgi:hypothetical protein